jgi:hypothetical protein
MEAKEVVEDRMSIVGSFRWDIKHLYTQNMIRNLRRWRESMAAANPESLQRLFRLHIRCTFN